MLVSIIIPVYNVAPYIEACLLSVMRQTYAGPIECLLVDDCGTDESVPIAEQMIAEYDGPIRFVILHHEHHRGVSAARNTGTMAANGEYIFYLDSDDEITEDCLERLSEPLRHDDSLEMIMGNYLTDCDAMPRKWWRCRVKPQLNLWTKETPAELRTNDAVRQWFYKGKWSKPDTVWNKLYRLDFIKKNKLFFQEGLLYEDNLWNYYLMRYLSLAAYVDNVTYLHHRRPGSICTSMPYEENLRYHGRIYEEVAKNVLPGERVEEIVWYVRRFSMHYIDAHDDPRYRFAFLVFYRELSDKQYNREALMLMLTHHLGKTYVGRLMFKAISQVRRQILFGSRKIKRLLLARM